MPEEVKKEYTFWESMYWHLASRRSRLQLASALTVLLVNHPSLGFPAEQAAIASAGIVALAYVMVGAISKTKPVEEKES